MYQVLCHDIMKRKDNNTLTMYLSEERKQRRLLCNKLMQMSGKEDGEGSQGDVWVVRSPLWRSPQLSSLLKRLQEKIDNQPSAS